MVKCDYCGKDIFGLPWSCKYCGGRKYFCIDHRLPEDHGCLGIPQRKSQKEVKAKFYVSISGGKSPLEVIFKNDSIGDSLSYYWDFGDGSVSNLQNPVHIYENPGTYSVALTVKDGQLSDTMTRKGLIQIFPHDPIPPNYPIVNPEPRNTIISNLPREELCKILKHYGISIIDNPQRLQAILNDMCLGKNQPEIQVIMHSLDEKIPMKIISAKENKIPYNILFGQLRKKMMEDWYHSEVLVNWAIDTWVIALGINTNQ